MRAFARTVDGQFQTFSANDGAYNRARFFGQSPSWRRSSAMTDEEIDRLHRGGHDLVKIHAAYAAAVAHRGAPGRDPRQDDEGLRHGLGRPGPDDHAPQKKLDAADLRASRGASGCR